jgi:ligand-binding sensor domain-containing protein/signal transduction histidine kinase
MLDRAGTKNWPVLRHWLALWCGWLGFWCAGPGLIWSAPAARESLAAASPFIITVWDTDAGLPQNSVTSILQTRDGYLWLGTLNGLVRFDGMRFAVFDESNTPGLNSSRIVKLFQDSHGRIWVGTESAGIVIIDDGQVSSLPIGLGALEKRLASICEDGAGEVWLCTASGEVWRYANQRPTPFRFELFRASAYRVVMAEPGGPVWIGTDWRQAAISSTPDLVPLELQVDQDLPMRKLDFLLASRRGGYWRLADGQIQKCRAQQVEQDWGPYPWGNDAVTAACEDLHGNLLVGTRGLGVYWFQPDGKFVRISRADGLSDDSVMALHVDEEGNLWVGTVDGGLNRVRRQVFDNVNLPSDVAAHRVQSIWEDPEQGLWIGLYGGGITRWRAGKSEVYGVEQGLDNLNVWSVYVDRKRRVWAGTGGGGLYQLQRGRFQPVAIPGNIGRTVFAMTEDGSGRLWIGTQDGLFCWDESQWKVYTSQDGLSVDEVRALAFDAAGDLWIGTVGGGLNRLHEGKFTLYRKQPDGLSSEDISSLLVDRNGVLWVGTFGSGLCRFHQGRWTRFTTRQGLISNSIGYLIEDGAGWLWIGSNAGIMRIQKGELDRFALGETTYVPVRTYDKTDGLPARECTRGSQPGACCDDKGTLWLPTVKGLVSVHPNQLNPNPNPPPVVIESVYIDGLLQNTNSLRAAAPSSVVVPAGRERIEIHYTSLNLSAPDRGRFRYRLEEHETEWVEAGNSRIARYSKLPPGEYRFWLKACNEDGIWNTAGSTLLVRVETPYWRTGWFLGTVAACLLGAIVGVVHYLSTQRLQRQLVHMRHQEALEKERARIAQDIHDQLGASLTQVAMLGELVESDKENPEEVQTHARQISQTARETTRVLDEIVWAVNPSNDTLDSLITYLCKYAQEFFALAGLRYRLEVPPQLPNLTIPPEFRHNIYLAFKESVTNVVRHARATEVWVRLKLEPGVFVLEIEDDGCGLAGMNEKAALTRNGLRGMRKRMEAIGGQFVLSPGTQKGARVRLAAPCAVGVAS